MISRYCDFVPFDVPGGWGSNPKTPPLRSNVAHMHGQSLGKLP